MSKVHSEIIYVKSDGTPIHSDTCPKNYDVSNLNDPDYHKYLHKILDEWLNNSNRTGGFYIAEEGFSID